MKKLLLLLIIIIILITVFMAFKNYIAQTAIINGVKSATGLDITVQGVSLNISKSYLSINDLKVLSSKEFNSEVMAYFSDIYINFSLSELFSNKVHIFKLRLNIEELSIIKNKENKVNVKMLSSVLPQVNGNQMKLEIESLNLIIGRILFKDDFSAKPVINEFNINTHDYYKNIQSTKILIDLVLLKALSKTDIPARANINIDSMKENVRKALPGQVDSVPPGPETSANSQDTATE